MSQAVLTFYPQNGLLFWLQGLQAVSVGPNGLVFGNYVNDATVVLTALNDPTGAALAGVTGILTYISGSNGAYSLTLQPFPVPAILGSGYRAILDAANPAAAYHAEIPAVVIVRAG